MSGWAAAGAAAGTLLGQLGNAWIQGAQNRKQREFEEHMYNRQIQDHERFWNMQNQYNSPEAQMARLRKAGLSPNLYYAQSSGNPGLAGQVQKGERPKGQFVAPQFDLSQVAGDFMNNVYKLETEKAGLDNIQKQNNLIVQDTINKAHDTLLKEANTDLARQSKRHRSRLINTQVQMAEEQVSKVKQETQTLKNRDWREAINSEQTLQKTLAEIAQIEASKAKTDQETHNLKQLSKRLEYDVNIRRLENELAEQGIMPGSPWYVKTVELLMAKILENGGTKGVTSNISSWMKSKVPKYKTGRIKNDGGRVSGW